MTGVTSAYSTSLSACTQACWKPLCLLFGYLPACGAATPPQDSPTFVLVESPAAVSAQPANSANTRVRAEPKDTKQRLRALLDRLQAEHAPDSLQEGEDRFELVEAEGTIESEILLTPGKCYSILAVREGTDELEMTLGIKVPPPMAQNASMPDLVLARDTWEGPQAAIGTAKNCFRWILPLPGPAVLRSVVRETNSAVLWRVLSR